MDLRRARPDGAHSGPVWHPWRWNRAARSARALRLAQRPDAAASLHSATRIVKAKTPPHRIGKRRATRIGVIAQQPTDNLHRIGPGQRALDLVLNFHGATIYAARENVQWYSWEMGRAGK